MTESKRGRPKGSLSQLPDLRAITLKALMKAGGVDYLTRQAEENPMGFMSLLGRVMPRESHVELTAEVRIRQEVRRDLVEKLVILMKAPTGQDAANTRETRSTAALPAITHTPDTMLKAALVQDREGLSRRAENARREGAGVLTGVVHRAAAMHLENDVSKVQGSTGQDAGKRDPGTSIENLGAQRGDGGRVPPRGRPYVCPPETVADARQPVVPGQQSSGMTSTE